MNSPISGKPMILSTRKEKLRIRGEEFEINYSYYLDADSDMEFCTDEMADQNLKQAWDQYNAKHQSNVGPFAL